MLAARIGSRFGMDPVAVLEEGDWRRTAIRVAALVVVAEDEARAFGGDDA